VNTVTPEETTGPDPAHPPAAASLRVFGSAPTNRWHFILAAGCAVIFWLTSAMSALLTLRTLNRTPRLSMR